MAIAMGFWSGETLHQRLQPLISPFDPDRIDCSAYTLAMGREVYVSPNDETADPQGVTIRQLGMAKPLRSRQGSSPFSCRRKRSKSPILRWASSRSRQRSNGAGLSMSQVFTSILVFAADWSSRSTMQAPCPFTCVRGSRCSSSGMPPSTHRRSSTVVSQCRNPSHLISSQEYRASCNRSPARTRRSRNSTKP